MVTLDNVVEDVKEFNGDLARGNKDHERSVQGLKIIEPWMAGFEDSLKETVNYSRMSALNPKKTVISLGEVIFEIISSKRIKRPAYKQAVVMMEDYLLGIENLISEGRAITGVLKRNNETYLSVDSLLTQYEITISGVMHPEVKHSISYEAKNVKRSKSVNVSDDVSLTKENAKSYVQLDMLKERLNAFMKSYQTEVKDNKQFDEEIIKATNKVAYESKESVSSGPNWANVVKTIVQVRADENIGELNFLSDNSVSLWNKRLELPMYTILQKETNGVPTLYVSSFSVFNRIQSLKSEKQVYSDRHDLKSLVLV